ncbi:MAG: tRNA pseudouridine(55) synthase TruB [Proteobacteria bacterium]|nr:tRNA pseudouridine(55) synthase TruB [Pseudomonadota bacterium]
MNAPRRAPRRSLDGVLLLDKPLGLTSNAALQSARRLYNAAKAGHTGTLDPLATGLLPLCFGEASKFAGELLDADKTYVATLRLGVTTDTADAEGKQLVVRPVQVSRQQLDSVLHEFVGEIMQIPPMHSALKRDGKPLYEYARQGIELERTPRRVFIHAIDLHEFSGETLSFTVDCSKGTYVRTLAEDIGEALGCGAHLAALRRTRIGDLRLEQAVTLADLEAMSLEQRDALLCAELAASDAARLVHGQAIRWSGSAGRWRAYAGSAFLGLCELGDDGWLKPRRLIDTTSENTTANT